MWTLRSFVNENEWNLTDVWDENEINKRELKEFTET